MQGGGAFENILCTAQASVRLVSCWVRCCSCVSAAWSSCSPLLMSSSWIPPLNQLWVPSSGNDLGLGVPPNPVLLQTLTEAPAAPQSPPPRVSPHTRGPCDQTQSVHTLTCPHGSLGPHNPMTTTHVGLLKPTLPASRTCTVLGGCCDLPPHSPAAEPSTLLAGSPAACRYRPSTEVLHIQG